DDQVELSSVWLHVLGIIGESSFLRKRRVEAMEQLIMESHIDPGQQRLAQSVLFPEDILWSFFVSLGEFLTET
ncbi:hypothetical protein, partial [[Clostridium] innocuum]|uniref:hypothetical protein n=1 Tax=Clostridium innocuum TaxID=1522 RepID=UPI0005D23FC1